jgi:hypothetical protein
MFHVSKCEKNKAAAAVEENKQCDLSCLRSDFTPTNACDESHSSGSIPIMLSKNQEKVSTAGNVATWGFLEVKSWAVDCGFTENIVLDNIYRYKINGGHMVKMGITASELGVSDAKTYDLKIKELRLRDIGEKLNVKRMLVAGNVAHKKMKKKAEISEENKEKNRFVCCNDDEIGFDYPS